MADAATSPPAHGAPGREGSRARRFRGPIDPRLLSRATATRWYLAAGVAVGCANAVLTLVQAWTLAHAIAGVFDSGTTAGVVRGVAVLAGVFAAKAALGWLNDLLAQRAAAAVKSQLRTDIVRARLARPLRSDTSTGGLIALVTQGLDALDGFYSKYLPQLVLAVTVPLIIGVAILSADLTSAIIVALTLPLIPVFMALVGWTTEARTRRRWRIQTRLAHHFADLIAGLPTLQVFGRARAQLDGLRRTESAHRAETMATLRVSFLSALVLELLSTLSVALVAVTVGFRVVAGDLDLATALFVLMLAPEAYLPVRQVGVHYHDAADGMAAAESAFALIDGTSPRPTVSSAPRPTVGSAPRPTVSSAPRPTGTPVPPSRTVAGRFASGHRPPMPEPSRTGVPADRFEPTPATDVHDSHHPPQIDPPTPEPTRTGVPASRCVPPLADDHDKPDLRPAPATPGPTNVTAECPRVGVERLSHTYPGSDSPAVSDVSFAVAPGAFAVLTGPSGGGKTTVLNALLGFVTPTSGEVVVDGRPLSANDLSGWRRRVAYVGQSPGMVNGDVARNVRMGWANASDAQVRAALDRAGAPELALGHPVGDDGEGLSAGERRRVATARALLRITLGGADVLLLDEPTAGLDADAEVTLLAGLRTLGVTAIVVSHRRRVIDQADAVVPIGGVA